MTIRPGDTVKPRPEWADSQNLIPSGKVRAVVPWGTTGAVYVEGDHRAFAADVFELDVEYDAQDDMTKSLAECYRAVRERQAAGGEGWAPK